MSGQWDVGRENPQVVKFVFDRFVWLLYIYMDKITHRLLFVNLAVIERRSCILKALF